MEEGSPRPGDWQSVGAARLAVVWERHTGWLWTGFIISGHYDLREGVSSLQALAFPTL